MGRQSQYPEKRDEIVRAIAHLIVSKNGHAPTIREIAEEADTSVGTLHSYLSKLVDEGLITWRPRTHRSIRLTEAGQALAESRVPF